MHVKCDPILRDAGDAFDVREFHDICLSCGQVPLDVLETIVENHILRKQRPEESNIIHEVGNAFVAQVQNMSGTDKMEDESKW